MWPFNLYYMTVDEIYFYMAATLSLIFNTIALIYGFFIPFRNVNDWLSMKDRADLFVEINQKDFEGRRLELDNCINLLIM